MVLVSCYGFHIVISHTSVHVYRIISYCLDEPLDVLVDYFKTFGHKLCCFDDTHVYITKLLTTADADKVGMATIIVHHTVYAE